MLKRGYSTLISVKPSSPTSLPSTPSSSVAQEYPLSFGFPIVLGILLGVFLASTIFIGVKTETERASLTPRNNDENQEEEARESYNNLESPKLAPVIKPKS